MTVTPIPATLDEALSVLSKWRDEQTPINLTLLGFAVEFNVWRSIVRSISGLKVDIDEGHSVTTLDLKDAVFTYCEPRIDDPNECPQSPRVLTIAWPATGQRFIIDEAK